ncbi:NAD(P)/FAD-dependent oxidoreductase [Planctomicrobium sp. SH661]|uniref:NAD(P)/FAD-dependent oxidoreductase n=1 Tax=Planctomicrobium sp. SH661 TaxID=3448124 RepID=UPI003F5C4050
MRLEDHRLNVAAAFDRDFIRNCGTPGAAASRILSESGFRSFSDLESAHWQGTPSLTRRLSVPASERVLVIGDAAGYVEPFTGEGIAWALASAQAVVPLVLRGVKCWTPALQDEWASSLKRLLHRRQWMCRQLAFGLRRTWLVHGATRLYSRFWRSESVR